MKKHLHHERGNITLFLLGMISIMFILFMVIINFAKVYAVKEKSFTTSQQASLAASAEFYERVWDVVAEFDDIDEENLPPPPDADDENPPDVNPITKVKIKVKVGLKEDELRAHYGNEKSENEIHIEAIDEVLAEELTSGLGKRSLRRLLSEQYESRIKPAVIDKARNTILANGGQIEEAQIALFHENRIYIKAANEYVGQGKYFDGLKEKVFQTGAGPEIGFISELGISHETIRLSNNRVEEVIWSN